MKNVRRLLAVLTLAALVALAGYDAGWSSLQLPWQQDDARAAAGSHRADHPDRPRADRPPPDQPGSSSSPAPDETSADIADGVPADASADLPAGVPALQPGPAILAAGEQGAAVRDLQARLRQIEWFDHDVTGYYGEVTTAAVEGFQDKRGFPVTGEVDDRTWQRLLEMTTEPTAAELDNRTASNVPGALDPRCLSGDVLCIDKTSQTLRWVVDGTVERTVDVRFGAEYTPTREGTFEVESKSRDHVSSLYGSEMPFAMFFSGGQAVHYSADFAAVGYAGASHGCVNVRDYDAVAWLFDHVDVGDAVIVYRS